MAVQLRWIIAVICLKRGLTIDNCHLFYRVVVSYWHHLLLMISSPTYHILSHIALIEPKHGYLIFIFCNRTRMYFCHSALDKATVESVQAEILYVPFRYSGCRLCPGLVGVTHALLSLSMLHLALETVELVVEGHDVGWGGED